MTHRATKLEAGRYEYRGYELFNCSGYGSNHWNVTPPECDGPTDSANTMRGAKTIVDMYEDA